MKSQIQQQVVKSNFTKYLNPSQLIQQKSQRTRSELSNIHCRSMEDLELNMNGGMNSSKENIKPNVHHSSFFNQKENINIQQENEGKSRSLNKFISFFQNSNVLKENKKDTNQSKKKNYNGFSYDLKISSNSAVNNGKKIIKKKDKENINYQTLTTQNQSHYISQTKSPMIQKNSHTGSNSKIGNFTMEIQKMYKMRETLQGYKQREQKYCEKIEQLQQREQELFVQCEKLQKDKQTIEKKLGQYEAKIRQLEGKNKQIQQKYKRSKQTKTHSKQSRQQDMVVKSLKKVINEQLNKIIELERYKIENQYLREKLGEVSFVSESYEPSDYSFQIETKRRDSMGSAIKQEGKEMFRKLNNIRDEIKATQKDKKSNTHFKSFFEVQDSPISSSEGNIMNLFKPYESRRKTNNSRDSNQKRQQTTDMIKISEPQSSFTRQAIEEVNEQHCQQQYQEQSGEKGSDSMRSNELSDQFDDNEDQELRQEQDSILQEVDEYLTKWRRQQ